MISQILARWRLRGAAVNDMPHHVRVSITKTSN